jgi:hypothetical protein
MRIAGRRPLAAPLPARLLLVLYAGMAIAAAGFMIAAAVRFATRTTGGDDRPSVAPRGARDRVRAGVGREARPGGISVSPGRAAAGLAAVAELASVPARAALLVVFAMTFATPSHS